jgi:hypothetical protein
MTRLPKLAGASIATPNRNMEEFKRALSKLCNRHVFDDSSADQYYFALGRIIGGWYSEEGRLKAAPIAKALRKVAKDLKAASALLGGLATGIHGDLEIAVASRVLSLLSEDPTVGSPQAAYELLCSFQQNAERISHICLIAAADLPNHLEKRGARKKDWYDAFVALLLDVAEKAGDNPTLNREPVMARQGSHAWRRSALHEDRQVHPLQRDGAGPVDEGATAPVDQRTIVVVPQTQMSTSEA